MKARIYLEEKKTLVYRDIQSALMLTGGFTVESDAFRCISSFPYYPTYLDENGNEIYDENGYTLKFKPTPDKKVSLKSALLIFDWCVNNNGKEN